MEQKFSSVYSLLITPPKYSGVQRVKETSKNEKFRVRREEIQVKRKKPHIRSYQKSHLLTITIC